MELSKYEQLQTLLNSMAEDVDKFYNKGNKSAGIRLRKTLQEVKDVSQQFRLEITAIKKTK